MAWKCWLECLPSYVGRKDQATARDGKRREVWARKLAQNPMSLGNTECGLLGCYEGILVKERR